MKRKHMLIACNLIAPGIGQILGGMWLRGALQLLTATVCALWCLLEVFGPIAISVRNMLSENGGDVVMPNLWRIAAALGLLALLYAWSIIELALVCKEEPEAKSADPAKTS